MRKTGLDPRILEKLKKKLEGKVSENSIRPAISRIRRENPSLTLNAAAEVFAKKHNESVTRYLNEKDRESLKAFKIEKISIPSSRPKRAKQIIEFAKYETKDEWLKAHIEEINKTYTFTCYTATFILCRKVLENLVAIHILEKKYPGNKQEHRQKYFDFRRNRILDFDKLLMNLRNSSTDFIPKNNIVSRICDLADGFKEDANEMTHSLYHIATKKEVDEKNFQQILDLIAELEKSITVST